MQHNVVKKILKDLEGRVAFIPGYGNAGDALIASGTYNFFGQIGFEPILKSRKSLSIGEPFDIIVLGGGGGFFVSQWVDTKFLQDMISNSKKIVFLPQSVSNCNDQLQLLRCDDQLILREKKSYDYCVSLNLKCSVHLDHDMALFYDENAFKNIKGKKSLSVFGKRDFRFWLFYFFNYVNSRFRRELIAMRTDSESVQKIYKPRYFLDISNSTFVTAGFDDVDSVHNSAVRLKKLVELYDEVITDRLHIAIAGFLLGKKVKILDQNYGKISEVSKFSELDFIRLE
jgi:exopolysaccharide biosynthesis predicted pyruvyltransferase EpsI